MKAVFRSRLPLVLHLFGESLNISMELSMLTIIQRKVMTIMMTMLKKIMMITPSEPMETTA